MKKIAKWNWLRIIRDWKTRILLLLFFIFFSSFSILYRQQDVTFPAIEMKEEYEDERQIYRLIPRTHFEGELGEEVQKTLGSNSVALGVNRYILNRQSGNKVKGMDSLPDYIENGQKIVENNLFLYEATEFESYDLLVDVYLPPLEEVKEQKRFYDAMEKKELDIEWNPYSTAQVMKTEVELLAGISLYLFIALLAADHFTKDQIKNKSITQGLPIPWKTQWRLRSSYLWLLYWLTFIVGLFTSYLVSRQIETKGSFIYPTAIYQKGAIHYIPLWQYLVIVILASMLLSYALLLLMTGLSWVFRNVYLTMILGSSLFLLPQIWTVLKPFSSWQPSLYLNYGNILSGTTSKLAGISTIVWWKAFIIYSMFILIIELVFKKVFSYIPSTSGLQRRKI